MKIRIVYHYTPEGGCWASSPDIPGFTVVVDDPDNARREVLDALKLQLQKEIHDTEPRTRD